MTARTLILIRTSYSSVGQENFFTMKWFELSLLVCFCFHVDHIMRCWIWYKLSMYDVEFPCSCCNQIQYWDSWKQTMTEVCYPGTGCCSIRHVWVYDACLADSESKAMQWCQQFKTCKSASRCCVTRKKMKTCKKEGCSNWMNTAVVGLVGLWLYIPAVSIAVLVCQWEGWPVQLVCP